MEIRSAIENFGRIGVFMGGPSSEREISLKSGKAVYEALKSSGLEVIPVDIRTEGKEENVHLISAQNIDCAFLALHGRFGEDGTIQQILEDLDIPYTGSGVQASRLAMDKIASREIFQANNLYVPHYAVLEKTKYSNGAIQLNNLHLPLVVKPATGGSSIGLSIVESQDALGKAIELAFSFDKHIMVEQYIKGREMTVGILNDCALPVIEIVPKNQFFDFEAKYQPGMTEYIVPAVLDNDSVFSLQHEALLAHRLLGCYGCSRVDIILNSESIPFILEVNTIPGLTSTSLLPKAAKIQGIEFVDLCLALIALAYEKARV